MTPKGKTVAYETSAKTRPVKQVRETPVGPLLLDTAVLLWWLQDPAKLSRPARAQLAMLPDAPLLVSSVSFWEIGMKSGRGLMDLGDSFDGFMRRIESMSGLSILPVDLAIWRQMLALDWAHRDPADRIIVATSMHYRATLLSSDRAIRSFHPDTVW